MARKCTRCRNAEGIPTGIVLGGECFLCHGHGEYTRETVTPEAKAAGRRRGAAVDAIRAATQALPLKQRLLIGDARMDLEQNHPGRHLRLIESVLAGRTADVIAALIVYANQEGK